jgi:hypothetical protein
MTFRSRATLLGTGPTLPAETTDTPGYPTGTRFVANGEDAEAEHFNRAYAALAENTDDLNTRVTRDIGVPEVGALTAFSGNSIDIDPSGGAAGDVNYTGTLYLGESGWTGQERLDQLFQLLDENYEEVSVGGVEAKITGLTGNSLGDGFVATATTLNLNVSIPSGNYRIGYYAGSTVAELPPYAFTHAGLRGLEEVSGELKTNKARLEIAELTLASPSSTIDIDPTAGGGGDYDLSPAGFVYLGGSAYTGGGTEEAGFLFQLLDADYNPLFSGGVPILVSSTSPVLGSGFYNGGVVTLTFNATVPVGSYRLLIPRDDNVSELADDALVKGVMRYAHDHTNLKGYTAVLSDGTNSSGGDYNSADAIDAIDSFTYGGTFALKRGRYTWNSVTSLAKPNVTVHGELFQWGVTATTDLTSMEIPAGAAADFNLSGKYSNLILSSKAAAYRYKLTNPRLENVQIQSGCGYVEGEVFWKGGGCTASLSGNNPAADYTFEFDGGLNQVYGLVEDCDFTTVPPAAGAQTAFVRLNNINDSADNFKKLTFRNCQFGNLTGVLNCSAVVMEGSTGWVEFENCVFYGYDGGYCLDVVTGYTQGEAIFRNCRFYTLYGTVAKARGRFENCQFESGSIASASWGQMLEFRYAQIFDCTANVGTGSTETNPASASDCIVQIGSSSVGRLYVDGFNINLPDTWHGYTPVVVESDDSYDAEVKRLYVRAGSSGPVSDRSTNGVLGYAAVVEIIGYGSVSFLEKEKLYVEDLRVHRVGWPSSATDNGTVVSLKNCRVNRLTIDGASTSNLGHVGSGAGVLYCNQRVSIRDLIWCPSNSINCDHTGIITLGSETSIDGGIIHRLGEDPATTYLFEFVGSYGMSVTNLSCPWVNEVDTTVALFGSTATCKRIVIHNNSFSITSGITYGPIAPFNFGANCTNVRVTNNTLSCKRTVALAASLLGDGCLVDGNIFEYTTSSTAPTITNSGTGSVTGDNVLHNIP